MTNRQHRLHALAERWLEGETSRPFTVQDLVAAMEAAVLQELPSEWKNIVGQVADAIEIPDEIF